MIKHFLKLFFFSLMLLFSGINYSHAQLTFNNGLTAQQLAQMLAGPGVHVSNAAITCASNAIGSFAGSSSIGITNGILLTNGSTSAASPNTNSASAGTCNSSPGDSQLNSIAGAATFDACTLEFDIIPLCDTLTFKYVFGSEEYPEYVNTAFNDAFAFFISGPGITGQQNIALVPGTSAPVTINSINSGNNPQYYVTNSGTTIEYDGYTTILTAWALVQSCQSYHLKIVIADGNDCIYDSGIFLKAGSLQCQAVSAAATVQNAIEGCQNGAFQFCRPGSTASALTIPFTIAGTAVNGTDYNTISSSVTIPAGQSCVSLPIIPIADGLSEPTETIFLIYQPGVCPVMDTAKIFISDSPALNAGPDKTLCTGIGSVIGIPPVSGITYSWSPATGLSNAAISNPAITLTNGGSSPVTTNYILTAAMGSCTVSDTVKVKVNPLSTVNAGIDQTICTGTAVLAGSAGGGAVTGTWSGGTGTFNPNDSTLNSIYTPSAAEIDAGSITLTLTAHDPAGACPSVSDQMIILINPQAIISAGPDQTICTGNTVTLAGSVGGSAASGIWSGGTGTYNPDNTQTSPVYTPSTAEETAGTVTLTFTSNNPNASCTPTSDQMVITINHFPTANAGSGQYVCSGSNISLAGAIGGSASSSKWIGGTGTYSPDSTVLNAVYTPSAAEYAAGSVTLTLITNDPAGPCTFSSSNVIFHFYPSPAVDFTAANASGCPVLCTSFTNSTIIGGGNTIVSWNWNFGDGGIGSSFISPAHCFPLSGLYDIKLTAVSNNGCSSSLTKTHLVQVFNIPAAAFTSSPNPATVLDPTITFNNQSSPDVNYWHWDFGDSTSLSPGTSSPVHNYPAEISSSYLVTLIVHNVDGCYDTAAHKIIIKPEFSFFLPNSFSPNGDGINDYFFASGVGIKKYDLWIFDRWGNMIFHIYDFSGKWDGKANSSKDTAEIDVYVWKVEITDVFNQMHDYIGTVSVVK